MRQRGIGIELLQPIWEVDLDQAVEVAQKWGKQDIAPKKHATLRELREHGVRPPEASVLAAALRTLRQGIHLHRSGRRWTKEELGELMDTLGIDATPEEIDLMIHEIDQDKIDRSRGMDITVVTTATTDDQGRALLKQLGFPFKEN